MPVNLLPLQPGQAWYWLCRFSVFFSFVISDEHTELVLRFPNGKRKKWSIPNTSKLMVSNGFNFINPLSNRCGSNFSCVIFKHNLVRNILTVSSTIALMWMSQSQPLYFNIGPGNGLVPSGTKSIPEPMLTKGHYVRWRHQTKML